MKIETMLPIGRIRIRDPYMDSVLAACGIDFSKDFDKTSAFLIDGGNGSCAEYSPTRVRNLVHETIQNLVRQYMERPEWKEDKSLYNITNGKEQKMKTSDSKKQNLVNMPELNRFYTYIRKDDDGVKTLHLKAVFDDRSEVEVKGVGDLAFNDGGKGDMLENAKEVGLMYAIVRRLCGIKSFRQTLEALMAKEVVSQSRKQKKSKPDAEADAVPDKTEKQA